MADGVERNDSEPLYLRIRSIIAQRIEDGEYRDGMPIPSDNELCQEFNVARQTIRNALKGLVENDTIRRLKGRGSYVSNSWSHSDVVKLEGFREETASCQTCPTVRTLTKAKRPAGPYYSDLFGINEAMTLFSVKRLTLINGSPIAIEHVLIPMNTFKGIERVDLSLFSLYDIFDMFGHRAVFAQERFSIDSLSSHDALLLNQTAGDPVLARERISYDATSQPIEFSVSLNRADHQGFTYRF